MKDALIQLSKGIQTGPSANLVPVLFGENSPMRSKDAVKFSPFNKNLDDSQVRLCFCFFTSFLRVAAYVTFQF